jgi:uncharacterized protein (DUF1800 family)
LKEGPAASVDRFLKPRPSTEEELQVLESLKQGLLDSGDPERLKAWWLYRILYDSDPLREKMTLFWNSHFATSNRKVRNIHLMLEQNEVFRRHSLEDFSLFLNDIISDGAMLIWLDGADNKKTHPNENCAREFLELFTLGIGNYTEADVREAARAFTGWSRPNRDDNDGMSVRGPIEFHFEPELFDDGVKTFLMRTGPWKSADIVRITLEQPAAAMFLCRKLYRFFVDETEEPSDELLRPLAGELRRSNYSIRKVVEIILRSERFYSQAAYRRRIKGPVEYSAGLVRSLEVPRRGFNLLALAVTCERQGQELFYPPSVKGWDGGKSWINSATLIERGNWASDVVWGNPVFGLLPFEPAAWARKYDIAPNQALSALAELLLQGDLSPPARELVMTAGRDGKPDSLRKAVQLLLHCPEYQLA